MALKNKVQIVIDGKAMTLVGMESEEYLKKVADYITQKMAAVKSKDTSKSLSANLISVLTSINIADDYFKEVEKNAILTADIAKLMGGEALPDSVEELKKEVTDLRLENSTLNEKINLAYIKNNDIEAEVKAAADENTKIKMRNESLSAENLRLRQKIEAIAKEKSELIEKSDKLEKNYAKLESRHSLLVEQSETLNDDLQYMRNSYAELKKKLAEKDEELKIAIELNKLAESERQESEKQQNDEQENEAQSHDDDKNNNSSDYKRNTKRR